VPPLRPLIGWMLVAVLLAGAAWSLRVLPHARWVSESPATRTSFGLIAALILLAAAGWVYFVLPAYWD
jgi:hypothetical protein